MKKIDDPGRTRARRSLSILCAVFALVAADLATAGDGRVEISQAAALAGGVGGNPLDLPGFPVTISEGGSYVLTSNLVVPDGNPSISGIVVTDQAGDLSIDLGGFEIDGPSVCTGTAPGIVCTNWFGSGILMFEPATGEGRATIVRNGRISGFSVGLSLSPARGGCIVRDMTVTENKNAGIGVAGTLDSQPCLLVENVVRENSGSGLGSYSPAILRDNVVHGNNGTAMSTFVAGAFHDNTVRDSGAWGISMGLQGIASGNSIERSRWSGIMFDRFDAVVGGSLLIDNVIRDNGSGISPPQAELDLSACAAGYVGQVITTGAHGATIDPCTGPTPLHMAPNLCDGSTTCP